MSAGLLLRHLRETQGWSQEYVANELDISQPSYCSLELDRTKLSIKKAKKLSELYSVPVDIFFEDNNSIINYNTGNKSRTIINSQITKESLYLGEKKLYEDIIAEKNSHIEYLKKEIIELRAHIKFLQKQLENRINS